MGELTPDDDSPGGASDHQPAKPVLRCGVLIVGSLIWDEGINGVRENWRSSRLDFDKRVRVTSHLRYGRRSETRDHTFTMVLDAECPDGHALILPCKAEIREIDSLAEEVRWMWSAENNSAVPDGFHKNWGCVGALFGPKAVASGLQDEWRDHFQSAGPSSLPALDDEGKLNIPWPSTSDGALAEFDIIIATATMPNPKDRRPDAAEIAHAWIQQNNGRERYFFENVRHDIRTVDDLDIWKAITVEMPQWLKSAEYAEAINKLQSEAQPQRSK